MQQTAFDLVDQMFGVTPGLRTRAREYAKAHVLPVAARHDREATYPHDAIAAAREAGLLNTVIPASLGGTGMSCVDDVVIAEEVGYGCASIWTTLAIRGLTTVPIAVGGTPEQQRILLGSVADGAVPAFALTEPNGGSDVAAITTTARREGGDYVISGMKRYISTTDVATFFVLFAKTDPTAGRRGISAFVVPRDAPGLTVTHRFDKFAHRCYDTSEIALREVIVPETSRIGAEGDGFTLAMAAFDRNRPAVAAAGVGLARRARDEALARATSRTAFNTTVIDHQAVSHKIADIDVGISAGRLLCLAAAKELDEGRRNVATAAKAKVFATDLAMRAATDAVQIFGAAGIMRENPVEKLMRDAKVLQVYEGTNEIQRNIVVRDLVREQSLRPEHGSVAIKLPESQLS